jgi:hypothetical protein
MLGGTPAMASMKVKSFRKVSSLIHRLQLKAKPKEPRAKATTVGCRADSTSSPVVSLISSFLGSGGVRGQQHYEGPPRTFLLSSVV